VEGNLKVQAMRGTHVCDHCEHTVMITRSPQSRPPFIFRSDSQQQQQQRKRKVDVFRVFRTFL
jgi:hypothetical protein